MVLRLRDAWGSLQHQADHVRNCADLLDAAGAVVDYQLCFGVSMEVAVVCGDGSVLQSLAFVPEVDNKLFSWTFRQSKPVCCEMNQVLSTRSPRTSYLW